MRRQSEPLTKREANHVATTSAILFDAVTTGAPVTFKYRKADGSQTDRSGVVLETLGADDTLSVKVDTPSGVRTFNIGGITHLRWQ